MPNPLERYRCIVNTLYYALCDYADNQDELPETLADNLPVDQLYQLVSVLYRKIASDPERQHRADMAHYLGQSLIDIYCLAHPEVVAHGSVAHLDTNLARAEAILVNVYTTLLQLLRMPTNGTLLVHRNSHQLPGLDYELCGLVIDNSSARPATRYSAFGRKLMFWMFKSMPGSISPVVTTSGIAVSKIHACIAECRKAISQRRGSCGNGQPWESTMPLLISPALRATSPSSVVKLTSGERELLATVPGVQLVLSRPSSRNYFDQTPVNGVAVPRTACKL